jgi:hypothetical protein
MRFLRLYWLLSGTHERLLCCLPQRNRFIASQLANTPRAQYKALVDAKDGKLKSEAEGCEFPAPFVLFSLVRL